jgi:hypothetical protein
VVPIKEYQPMELMEEEVIQKALEDSKVVELA